MIALLWDEDTFRNYSPPGSVILCFFKVQEVNPNCSSSLCCHGSANGECEELLFALGKKILVEIPEWVTVSWTHGPLTHNLLDMEESFFGSVEQTLGFGGKLFWSSTSRTWELNESLVWAWFVLLVFYSTGLMRMSSYAEDVVVDFTLFSVYCVISTLSVLTKSKNAASNAKHKSVFVCTLLHLQKNA